ncbi:MAG: hypothetical protein RI897_622 [Verrucomicrobiota bacterium]
MGEAVDTSAIVSVVDTVLLLKVAGDGGVVLDDFAVVIDDPYRAVGSMGEVHGVGPGIGGGGELALEFVGMAVEREGRAFGLDQRSVENIAGGFTSEVMAVEVG